MSRILLTTWGTSGDHHPLLSLGSELKSRGHFVTLAGNPTWEKAVLHAGLDFLPAGPPQPADFLMSYPELFSPKNLGLTSLKILMEAGIRPALRETYDALVRAAPDYDVLVAHHFLFCAQTVADKTGIPLVTVCLSPSVTPSSHTLPASVAAQPSTTTAGKLWQSALWKLGQVVTAPYIDPMINELRRSEGFPPSRHIFFTHHSRSLELDLYSAHFHPGLPDWPKTKVVTGYCHWDPLFDYEPPADLVKFLEDGEPPWLFTLGTSAIGSPQGFYEVATEAMRGTKHRALLLTGFERNRPADLPANVFSTLYVPYGWIMPRSAGFAHQCGAGTTAQALRTGLPTLACPFAFDQPFHAMRLERLGVAHYLAPGQRTAPQLRFALDRLQESDAPARAKLLGEKIRAENGPATAASKLEEFLASLLPSPFLIPPWKNKSDS
jgi:UDP:flavonoid glycosyltransferase YjiC (YdhE family)